jgi:hypothetical protein
VKLVSAGVLAFAVCAAGCARKPVVLTGYESMVGVSLLPRKEPHVGADFYGEVGDPVIAAADGVVVQVGQSRRAGHWILLQHEGFGRFTSYTHLSNVIVARGDRPLRGEVIGHVGLFDYSAGVPHVHMELCTVAECGALETTEDPLAITDGCWAPDDVHPTDRLVLTYPVACTDRWYNPQPREDVSRWEHAWAFTRFGLGPEETAAVGSRALVSAVGTGDIDLMVGWDGHYGLGNSGRAYQAMGFAGLAAHRTIVRLGLMGGVGVDRVGDTLPYSTVFPAEVFVAVSGESFRGQFWLRSVWVLDTLERQDGALNAVFGGDELALGMAVRIPPRSRYGFWVGAQYQEAREGQWFTLMLGASLDLRLAPLR